jgi:hypothetical protein
MVVMVIARRAVMWLQNDLIQTGRPENATARKVIVQHLPHGSFTVTAWRASRGSRVLHRRARVAGECDGRVLADGCCDA